MDVLLLLGALLIAFLIFTWLLKVVRATISLAITVAVVVILLYIFGISPGAIWQQLQDFWGWLFRR